MKCYPGNYTNSTGPKLRTLSLDGKIDTYPDRYRLMIELAFPFILLSDEVFS